MDINERQKLTLLFVILAFFALIFYYNLLLRPQFSRFIAKNREFCSIRARVREAERLIANKDNINRQYESLKKEAESLEKKLPAQEEISSLLEAFSSIAESSGVKILKIQPLDVVYEKIYSEFPILIEAKAGYHQCGVFINKLENMDRFIEIESVDIKGSATDLWRHDIKLKLVTYVLH